MKDVGWGDFLIALVLAPVLVLPVVGVVYVLLFVALRFEPSDYPSWLQVTIIVTAILEGLLISTNYQGRGRAIEHRWAWLAVVAAIAVAAAGLHVGGYVSAESAYVYALALYNYVAWAFIIAMLSVFLSSRTVQPDPIDRKRMDLEQSATISLLRK